MNDLAEMRCLREQVLGRLESRLDDIKRIADHGPSEPQDLTIIRMAMHFVAGEIHSRKAELESNN